MICFLFRGGGGTKLVNFLYKDSKSKKKKKIFFFFVFFGAGVGWGTRVNDFF